MLQAKKKNENVYSKNTLLCTLAFLASCILLVYSYISATVYFNQMQNQKDIIKVIVLGAAGTILLFWSISGFILKIFSRMKNTYHKELNCFVIKQFSSQVNTMIISMSVISIMLFVTICVLSSAFSLSNSMNNSLKKYVPTDVEMINPYEATDKDLEKILTDNNFDLNSTFDSYVVFNDYVDGNLTLKTSLGSEAQKVLRNNPNLKMDIPESIVKLSDYNKVAQIYGHKTYTLENDETDDAQNNSNIESEIISILHANGAYCSTKTELGEKSIGLKEMFTFVGLYVGIIFLIASVAVLALKELSESADNIERYTILREIGADEKMINCSLFKQIGIFFLLPLVVASIHSIFGIQFATKTMESFGSGGLTSSIVLTAIIIAIIYGLYFVITYNGSKNMIKASFVK